MNPAMPIAKAQMQKAPTVRQSPYLFMQVFIIPASGLKSNSVLLLSPSLESE